MARSANTKNFMQRQVGQIKDGGIRAIFLKLRKLARVLWMNALAPLAVALQVRWPAAYAFEGKRRLRKYHVISARAAVDQAVLGRLLQEAVRCFQAVIERDPRLADLKDWSSASSALQGLYQIQGNISEWNAACRREAEVRCDLAKTRQWDELGIEFIPKRLVMGSIGVYEHLEAHIKAKMLGLIPAKKLILLLEPGAPVNNLIYLNYWRRYITVISDRSLLNRLAPLEDWLTIPLTSYISLNGKMHKSFLALGKIREQWLNEKRLPLLTLSDEDYERGWSYLKSVGLRQNDWFVCLHVRESGWRGNDSVEEDYRNADIRTYYPAIKSITGAGGWVVRMGDRGMRPLPEMPKVIDYALSNEKSDRMDIFLSSQCRFFIGTSSGLYTFAMAFGVPVVMTNLLPTCAVYYFSSKDLFLPRLCRNGNEGRYLSFTELLSPPLATAVVKSSFDQKDIEIMSNTEEELKDVVEEMLERCEGRLEYGQSDDELQKGFQAAAKECGNLYDAENAVVHARLGRNFLRKHAALLNSGEKVEAAAGGPLDERKRYGS